MPENLRRCSMSSTKFDRISRLVILVNNNIHTILIGLQPQSLLKVMIMVLIKAKDVSHLPNEIGIVMYYIIIKIYTQIFSIIKFGSGTNIKPFLLVTMKILFIERQIAT